MVAQIRRKWNVAPAWSVEFVAYYHDRADRVSEFQQSLATTVLDNGRLAEEDEDIVAKYRDRAAEAEEEREVGERLRLEVARYTRCILTVYLL